MDEARLKVTDRLIAEEGRRIVALEKVAAKWAAKLGDARQRRDGLLRERVEQTRAMMSDPQSAAELPDELP